MAYREVEGNLIELAKQGMFQVITHGCNCFCRMKRGIAPQMAQAFGCDKFKLENKMFEGDYNKLGQIDYEVKLVTNKGEILVAPDTMGVVALGKPLAIVNSYTQYQWGTHLKPFDYDAFRVCMKKINHIFKGKTIGLPQIGSHLAGGNWVRIKMIIQKELIDCDVTVVIYKAE